MNSDAGATQVSFLEFSVLAIRHDFSRNGHRIVAMHLHVKDGCKRLSFKTI